MKKMTKKEYDEYSKKEVEEITSQLEEGVKATFGSSEYKRWLNVLSRLYNYSASNTMLILTQMPEATMVASFTKWKSLGRSVKKGEHAIKVLSPVPKSYKKKKIDSKTKEVVLDEKGNPIYEKVDFVAFKVASVFDVSQTEGKDLPKVVHELNGDVDDYNDLLSSICHVASSPINFTNDDLGGAKGRYVPSSNTIDIRTDLSEEQTVKTLLHELAHSILHKDSDVDRERAEVEAESVAYTVCQHYGIDTSSYSFGYVASWSKNKTVKELQESMKEIRSCAYDLIKKLDFEMGLVD